VLETTRGGAERQSGRAELEQRERAVARLLHRRRARDGLEEGRGLHAQGGVERARGEVERAATRRGAGAPVRRRAVRTRLAAPREQLEPAGAQAVRVQRVQPQGEHRGVVRAPERERETERGAAILDGQRRRARAEGRQIQAEHELHARRDARQEAARRIERRGDELVFPPREAGVEPGREVVVARSIADGRGGRRGADGGRGVQGVVVAEEPGEGRTDAVVGLGAERGGRREERDERNERDGALHGASKRSRPSRVAPASGPTHGRSRHAASPQSRGPHAGAS
jgi:hypothetical protein